MRLRLAAWYTRAFFRDPIFLWVTTLSGVLNLAIWGLMGWYYELLYQPERNLALHYKVFFGIDFLGEWYYVLVVPISGLFIIALNYILSRRMYVHQKAAVYALLVGSCVVQLILGWAAYLIIAINLF